MFNRFDGTMGINYFEDAASNPSRIDWNAIINQAFGVGSQAISAFSGAHGGIQVAYNPAQGGVFAIQPNAVQPTYNDPYAGMSQAQINSLQRTSGGGVAEDAFGSITNFVSEHPLVLAAGALGVYLLMKDPPRSRR